MTGKEDWHLVLCRSVEGGFTSRDFVRRLREASKTSTETREKESGVGRGMDWSTVQEDRKDKTDFTESLIREGDI